MSKLIDELLQEHKKLFSLLDELRNIGRKEVKEKLFESKNLFLSHLDKEDRLLYSKFDEAKNLGVNVEENVLKFKKEMEDISKDVVNFFDTYKAGIADNIQFAGDFGKIYSMIKIRMTKEEIQLYPVYEKHFG
ncbi:Hemerythrin HHE cation binding domain protein [Desulfurella amilsii]|uniref:Hemerythrin HHE cation binding domain protein n=1 Tax=Desulfurella amilsii TaxID=1562698 RepID=A0A1X4XW94_9BACT|nr:hemerythrin domain-containing protein [Desulfurella amilsii]OSS41794.1 Hemerythrin HHE cation binding domain protein [Desulfurella amilsii]